MKQPNAVDPPPKRSGGHEEIRAIYHETRGRAQSVEKIIISVDDATDSSDKCAFIKFVKKRRKKKKRNIRESTVSGPSWLDGTSSGNICRGDSLRDLVKSFSPLTRI